ncbi:MAG: helix-turn-helix domain-containing protein [Clostridia bacterium]|nr:helix-turn-helix domain-containing protein [Clostridia bacterium]
MDLVKIGGFIKELRKEKALTQEQLAEKFSVARRTVSRWETGSNMPDMDILIEMADFFEVDLRELLDGERKNNKMNQEMKETVLKVAEYTGDSKKRMAKMVLLYFVVGIISLIAHEVIVFSELPSTFLTGFLEGMTMSITFVSMLIGILFVTGKLEQVHSFKKRLIGKEEKHDEKA